MCIIDVNKKDIKMFVFKVMGWLGYIKTISFMICSVWFESLATNSLYTTRNSLYDNINIWNIFINLSAKKLQNMKVSKIGIILPIKQKLMLERNRVWYF